MSVGAKVMPGNDPVWCPRCRKVSLGENLVPPFGGWCPCGFSVPDCSKASEFSGYLAKELGLPSKALSCHAPWAWALMHGGKGVENRGLGFSRKVLGRVWVHASLWPVGNIDNPESEANYEFCDEIDQVECIMMGVTAERLNVKPGETFLSPTPPLHDVKRLRGHVVGSIEVVEYRTPDDPPDSPWYVPGSLGIMVRDPKPLATPVPAKGALGWWTPSSEFYRQVTEAA